MEAGTEGVVRGMEGSGDGGMGRQVGPGLGRRGQERCWAQSRGARAPPPPCAPLGASFGAQSPSLRPGSGGEERLHPHAGLGGQVVASPGGQSWPGGLGQLTGKEVTSRWSSAAVPGGATVPNSAPSAQGPVLGGRDCRGSGPAGGSSKGSAERKGSRRPPHISCEWSWRGCHRRVTGDTSESAQQQLRHRPSPCRRGRGCRGAQG